MDSAAIALFVAAFGVTFGWQPTDEGSGGYEYTVQLEPEIARMLERGEEVPIESVVPAEVTPIRKVKVVVGREELPRVARTEDAEALSKYAHQGAGPNPAAPRDDSRGELIIRGQSPDDTIAQAQRRTAGFAGQGSPWETSAAADRYNSPTGVAPPPGFIDRAGNAVNETASAVGQGIEQGFADANAQLNRAGQELWQGTQNTAQNVTQQLQATGQNLRHATDQTLGAVGNQLNRAAEQTGLTGSQALAASSNVGPVGGAPMAGVAPVRTATGWTSIGGTIAAPPLLPPPISASAASAPGGSRLAMNSSGPNFPVGASTNREPLDDGFSGANGAATGAGAMQSVPIRPITPSVPTNREQRGALSDPWEDNPFPELPAAQPTAGRNSDFPNGAGLNQSSPPVQPDWSTEGSGTLARGDLDRRPAQVEFPTNTGIHAPQGNGAPQSPPAASPQIPQMMAQQPPATQSPVADTAPWTSLLMAGVGLIGSLSANFFLGWSYLDARQRYESLARKTAQSFRRREAA